MDAIRAQYAANAETFRRMAAKAADPTRNGRKLNGYTADELAQSARDYARYAQMTDDELHAHFAACRERNAVRLAEIKAVR